MVNEGDKYCRACGSALNALGNCPHSCDAGDGTDEPRSPLRLVEDDEPWEPDDEDEEGRGW